MSSCNFTALTDLTRACSPALVAGGCLLFDEACRSTKTTNQIVLSSALSTVPPGTTLWVPAGMYHVDAGVYSPFVDRVTLRLEGTLTFGGAELQTAESVRNHCNVSRI